MSTRPTYKELEQKIRELETAEEKRVEEAIRAGNVRTRTILESITDGFILLDSEWRLTYFNDAIVRVTGMNREELSGGSLWELFPHSKTYKFYNEFHRAVETDTPAHFEEFYPEPINRWLECHCYPSFKGLSLYIRDITRRKNAEEDLRKAEEQLRLASEAGNIGVYEQTFDPLRIEWSNQLKRMFGRLADEAVGFEELIRRIHPEDRARVRAKMQESFDPAGTGVMDDEHRIVRTDGEVRWLHVRGRTEFAGGKPVKGYGAVHDITKRKKAEQELKELAEKLEQRVAERTELAEWRAKQLQALVSELTLAEQRERRRLADILHDHLQQFLIAAKINCEVLTADIGEEHTQAAAKIINLIDLSIQTSRSLTAELSPPVLQQGGLSAALEWLARWMQENNGLMIQMQTDPSLDPKREDIKVLLFLSIRELLFNVVKHAGVKSARLEMACDDENRLRVSIIDQGSGFDPQTIWEKAKAGEGFGLFSIRERLELLGGNLKIESSPGSGATFSLVIPVRC